MNFFQRFGTELYFGLFLAFLTIAARLAFEAVDKNEALPLWPGFLLVIAAVAFGLAGIQAAEVRSARRERLL